MEEDVSENKRMEFACERIEPKPFIKLKLPEDALPGMYGGYAASLSMTEEEAVRLMDALWRAGVRPSPGRP
jgi:hypothetical protein